MSRKASRPCSGHSKLNHSPSTLIRPRTVEWPESRCQSQQQPRSQNNRTRLEWQGQSRISSVRFNQSDLHRFPPVQNHFDPTDPTAHTVGFWKARLNHPAFGPGLVSTLNASSRYPHRDASTDRRPSCRASALNQNKSAALSERSEMAECLVTGLAT